MITLHFVGQSSTFSGWKPWWSHETLIKSWGKIPAFPTMWGPSFTIAQLADNLSNQLIMVITYIYILLYNIPLRTYEYLWILHILGYPAGARRWRKQSLPPMTLWATGRRGHGSAGQPDRKWRERDGTGRVKIVIFPIKNCDFPIKKWDLPIKIP